MNPTSQPAQRRAWPWMALMGAALLSILAWTGCGRMPDPWEGKGGPPRVLVTFPPIASFVKAVAGDQAGVICLCTRTGPHDYQFNIEDAYTLKRADLFLANGLGLDDHFADRLNTNSGNPKLRFRKLADSLPAEARKKNENFVPGEKHKHDENGGCCGGHGPFDPHAWLGLKQAIAMVGQVRDDLKAAAPANHAAGYDARAASYTKELEALLAEGKASLAKLKAPVITSHESMGYFADTFGLKVIGSIRGLDGQEGDGQKLANLVRACEGHGRVIVAVEPRDPRNAAKILEKELTRRNEKCEVIVANLDPLETCASEDEITASWYIERMRRNIDTLAKYAK